jgi:hypothetical protein
MARKNDPPTDPPLPSSQDWPEHRDPNPLRKGKKRGDTHARSRRRANPADPSHRTTSTAVRWIVPIVSWLFGATAEAARAATVQVLKYIMIAGLLTVVTGGSFIAFIKYDLFEMLGRIASNGQVAPKKPVVIKMPDVIEKELLNRQQAPSTPSDIETSGPKDAAPFPNPTPFKPNKPPPLPLSDWKTEIFRTPYY